MNHTELLAAHDALEQERDQLKARIDQLAMENFFILKNANAEYALSIAPATSVTLAEIQAQTIEDFQTYFDKEYYGEELSQFIEQYADRLRQQSTISE